MKAYELSEIKRKEAYSRYYLKNRERRKSQMKEFTKRWRMEKKLYTKVMKNKWKRYRFNTKSEDNRPLVFNPSFPWWESGFGDDYSICIAYLPTSEKLETYWPEAYDVEFTEENEITFSDRFPMPKYYLPLVDNGTTYVNVGKIMRGDEDVTDKLL